MNWSKVRLEEVCRPTKGEQLNSIELEDSGDYPCINGGISPSGFTDKYNTKENTITISEGGNSCGFVNFIQTKFWSGGHCYSLLNVASEIDTNFLYQALKGREREIMQLRVGSGLPNIQQKAIRQFEFHLPTSKHEQTCIAEILSTADAVIAQTEALIAKYRHIRTGLLADLLSCGIDERGRVRDKATHRFVVKDDVEVPHGWEVAETAEVLSGIEQGWSPDCESDPASGGEWGVLKTTAVTWERFDETENKRLPPYLLPKEQYEIKGGDVLVTRAGPNSRVGVVAFVETVRTKLMLSDKLYRLRPNKRVLPAFLAMALSSPQTQNHLSIHRTGMAESQTNISQEIVLLLKIALPPVPEQQQIIDRLKVTDSYIQSETTHLAKLQSIKRGLMADLLSGKVRVGQLSLSEHQP